MNIIVVAVTIIYKVDSLQDNTRACNDGMLYKGTCYFAVIQHQVDYSTSVTNCQLMGGNLAYIDSDEKFMVINHYLRRKLQDFYGNLDEVEYCKKDFWWGATYKNNEIQLNNGAKLIWTPQWHVGQTEDGSLTFPVNDPSFTNMGLAVRSDPKHDGNGVFNAAPDYKFNIVCQKKVSV